MCNGLSFPAWQAQTIQRLLELAEVEISLLIMPGKQAGSPGRLARLFGEPKHLLWNLYNKGYIQRRSSASQPVDMSAELGETPVLTCDVVPVGKYGEKLTDEDVVAVRGAELDLILRFGFGILKGEVLDTARYGIWSFHHGDERVYRGQPPGFWEIADGEPTVGTILQRITERLDGGSVLHRGTFRVVPFSYRRTRDDVFFGASGFPSIAVRQILNGDTSHVTAPPSTTDAPLRRSPTNWTMVKFLISQIVNFFRYQWNGLSKASKWTIGMARVPLSTLLAGDLPEFDWVPEHGRRKYLADPFPDPTGKTTYALAEDYDYEQHRGVISAIDLNGDLKPKVVLDTGIHASYPYLFEDDGSLYCVPETYQAGEVRIYRATSFPHTWDLVGTILDGMPVLDPTIFLHEGRWWLFCTFEGPEANTALHAFHAEQVVGPWVPHDLNPIKTDVSSSRPGGTPFVHDGALYRPAQDSSRSYGGAVAINRIDRLTPTEFSEEVVRRIGPLPTGRYRAGIHTLSGHDEITVVDGRRDVFILNSFRRELTGRIRRLLKRR